MWHGTCLCHDETFINLLNTLRPVGFSMLTLLRSVILLSRAFPHFPHWDEALDNKSVSIQMLIIVWVSRSWQASSQVCWKAINSASRTKSSHWFVSVLFSTLTSREFELMSFVLKLLHHLIDSTWSDIFFNEKQTIMAFFSTFWMAARILNNCP